jgi:uncharacterized protein (DUF433 family)
MTFDEIVAEYFAEPADIRAALEFANDLVEQEEFHLLPK